MLATLTQIDILQTRIYGLEFIVKKFLFFSLIQSFVQAAYNLQEFLQYDFIGAPWPHLKELGSGNGGLSLRSKSCMLKVLDNYARDENEDVFYSRKMKLVGCHVAPIEIAAKFSVELWYLDRRPLGLHKAYRYLNPQDQSELKRVCPEMRALLD